MAAVVLPGFIRKALEERGVPKFVRAIVEAGKAAGADPKKLGLDAAFAAEDAREAARASGGGGNPE